MKEILKRVNALFRGEIGAGSAPANPRGAFRLFREVLRFNNLCLETITDMGEKLGGDGPVAPSDIQPNFGELVGNLSRSLDHFDALTGYRYRELRVVLERIENLIEGAIFELDVLPWERTLFIENIPWSFSRAVGEKSARLAGLKNDLHLCVPEGFAITTRAYVELIGHNRLYGDIEGLAESASPAPYELGRLRGRIIQASIPPELRRSVTAALSELHIRCPETSFVAVRSSAEGEDDEFSFAGQFRSLLNVPLRPDDVLEAYKNVVASLFTETALAYQRTLGVRPGSLRMAVACMAMVKARISGVAYSNHPDGFTEAVVINGAWGLSGSAAGGEGDADLFVMSREPVPKTKETRIGQKSFLTASAEAGGTIQVATSREETGTLCLSTEQAEDIARMALAVEKHYRYPQDVEWAIDDGGRLFVLQTRPLTMESPHPETQVNCREVDRAEYGVIRQGGTVIQRGTGGGRVFHVSCSEDLDRVPRGAVLVARHDSPHFVRVMPYVSAIITEMGSLTSHMASLCRELRVPTVVNIRDACTALRQGEAVTVQATRSGVGTIYRGLVPELLQDGYPEFRRVEDMYEYRKKKYALRYVSPLNLVDPLRDDFIPGRCKTIHDVLRFMHEKSVAELVEGARYGDSMLRKGTATRLRLPIPVDLIVVDIGGGLTEAREDIALEQVASVPLRSLIKGMTRPGVWRSDAVALKARDFFSSMMRAPDIASDSREIVGYNVAVVSEEYVNLSLKFGYHYSVIDCYCSDHPRNNHIYFRFAGGATDIAKRSRRTRLIAMILKEYGFNTSEKGDIVTGRLAAIPAPEMEEILDQLGRVMGYTRQLDVLLDSDATMERLARNFLAGNYQYDHLSAG